MPKLVAALVLTLVASLGAFAPTAAAAGPKAVIVVGATHSATDKYRTAADGYYSTLLKYTSNVVRIYSPSATWSKVKAALNGASIVIYLGHGNGYPSPYATSPRPTTQNGFGLNDDTNGDGKLSDYENRYYGESYIAAEVDLAPNAVVLFNRLCYASGNSEPGKTAPTLSVAKQRVDNYGAGFIAAGARAVIADAIGSLNPYITSLFTTRKSIWDIWTSAPNFNNRAFTFASSRSAGYTAAMDPDGTANGYYRSVVGDLSLTADKVTGASYAPTDADPSSFVVPGAASAGTGGTTVYPNADLTGTPVATLPVDTAVRVDEALADTSGTPVLKVRTLSDTTVGYAASDELVPRDSVPPALWTFSNGGGTFDPGAPTSTGLPLSGTFSETAKWRLTVKAGDGRVVHDASGTAKQFATTWTGLEGGVPLPDGTYTWRLSASDGWGNAMAAASGKATIDSRDRRILDGSSFTPIDPQRFLDTRSGNGLTGKFTSGTPRTVQIAGRNGVPADAVAITGNLTVTGQTSSGYLSLGPASTTSPKTSTLNFPVSDNRANGVSVRLSAAGTLSIVFKGASGAKTHVVLDVTGYYRIGGEASLYVPVAPVRLLDTREGNGLANPFESGTPRTFQLAGRGDVPTGAVAITGNLTVTGHTSGGYVSVGPVPTATPTTSTINLPLGDTRANNLVVRLGDDGSLSAVFRGALGATAHIVLDVTGYYTTSGSGSLYVPLEPVRLLDTRSGNGLSGKFATETPRSFTVATRGQVPSGAVAVTGNLTVTQQSSAGYLTLGPTVAARPETSTLNFPRGNTRANGLASPLASGKVAVVFVGAAGSSTHVVFDADGYFRPPGG